MYYDPNNPSPEDLYPGGGGDYIPGPANQINVIEDPPKPISNFAAPLPDDPRPDDPYTNYNNGSPPDAPLEEDHGWVWTGSRWIQTKGGGKGWSPKSTPKTTPNPQPTPTSSTGTTTSGISGVPQAWSVNSSTLGGSVPTLADAIRDSKQLGGAPSVSPYAQFAPSQAPGVALRNQLVEAILNRPQVMDQKFQDQLFEQQKESQMALANQARQRAAQQGASRGMSGAGGYQAAAMGSIDEGFMNTLLAGKRDIATQAAKVNRESELAAIQMQEAVAQGDFVRANAAYETQLKAQNLYDELRFKAAEFDRANVALAAQTAMAGRQQQLGEQVASFSQYIEKLKFDELMRQFNEQMGLDYGKFGWQQQMDLVNRFPR